MSVCTVYTYDADPENTLFLRPEISKTALLRRKTLENGGMIGKSAVGKAWSLRKPEVFRSVIFICYRGCRPNIPSIQLRTVSKAKEVCQYMSVVEMQDFSIANGNFGAKGITLLSRGRILKRYIRNQLKKDAGQSLLTPDFAPFTTNRAAIVLSGCHSLKVFAGTVRVTPAYEEPRALCEALFIAPAAFFRLSFYGRFLHTWNNPSEAAITVLFFGLCLRWFCKEKQRHISAAAGTPRRKRLFWAVTVSFFVPATA